MVLAKTPQSIMDDPDDPRDVFDEIFYNPDSTAKYTYDSGTLKDMCWSRYRYTGIGNDDIDYWVRCMQDRCDYLMQEYFCKFRAWDKYSASVNPLDLTSIDMSSHKTESRSTAKHYDPPETSTAGGDASSYLDTQDVNEYQQKDSSGLDTVTTTEYINGIHNPYFDFMRDLDRLFYWGL